MSEREGLRASAAKGELAEVIAQHVHQNGSFEVMDGLFFNYSSNTTERVHGVSKPSLCVIAQGAKEVYLGDSVFRYDADRFLLVTVEIPVTGRVVEATPTVPYLAIRLELEPTIVSSVLVESGMSQFRSNGDERGLALSTMDLPLLDAILRLIRLVNAPEDARILGPMVRREIVYRLLTGEQGHRLRYLTGLGGHSNRIAQAIQRLRNEFDRPLRIESIAQELGMSSSGFHHHFKSITDMSPLQYQKQLRMQEARKLMLGGDLDAASAGYRVGYEDASHFSRDYKKHFGESPIRDIQRLRTAQIAAE